ELDAAGRPLGRVALSPKHYDRGLRDDLEVKREAQMIDVPRVERELALPRDFVASVHLRPSREAWFDVEALPLLGVVPRDVLHQERARPDDTHLAGEDVEQLGQLVEARAAKQLTDAGQPMFVGEQAPVRAFGARHRTKLEDR